MGGGSGYLPFESIHNVGNIDDFPNMVLSSSFDNLFEKQFFEKFIDKGYFQACQLKPLPSIYVDCGIEDPEKQFTIFAVVPFVFLIDHRKLDGLPIPRHWIDILDPIYHNKIIIGGWRKDENSPYSEFNSFLFVTIQVAFLGLHNFSSFRGKIGFTMSYFYL
ncbi:ABC transporter substrate-binding protein [Methanosarcina spelaei]|nr:ABC transporter substrate-binding protein [Methanosarcina spelaei]